jgi:glycosyltransferase involved in cell wall biosynthesis
MWGGCHTVASVFNKGHTIFVSDFNRDHSLKRGYVQSHTSTKIYNGVPDIVHSDIGHMKPSSIDGTVRLVMVARLAPEKDHETVLKALSNINDLDWQIDFAGNGDVEAYNSLAEKFGVANKCNFLGEVSDIPKLLSEKDILVHGSHEEALGIAVIEGMRAKLPVVASHVGGLPELVEEDNNGYTFPDSDDEVLSNHLRELIKDRELRTEMGAVGRSFYENNFRVTDMAAKTSGIYHKVIDKHKSEIHVPRPSFLRCVAS